MQDEVCDWLKVITKMHRTFYRNNLLSLRINTDVRQDRPIQTLTALAADKHVDARFAVDYLEQGRGSNLGRSAGIHGPLKANSPSLNARTRHLA